MKKLYPSDLSDKEYELIASLIPPVKSSEIPRIVDVKQVLYAILYFLKTDCQWRMLPRDFSN